MVLNELFEQLFSLDVLILDFLEYNVVDTEIFGSNLSYFYFLLKKS